MITYEMILKINFLEGLVKFECDAGSVEEARKHMEEVITHLSGRDVEVICFKEA